MIEGPKRSERFERMKKNLRDGMILIVVYKFGLFFIFNDDKFLNSFLCCNRKQIQSVQYEIYNVKILGLKSP